MTIKPSHNIDRLEYAEQKLALTKENFDYRLAFAEFKKNADTATDEEYHQLLNEVFSFFNISQSAFIMQKSRERFMRIIDPNYDHMKDRRQGDDEIITRLFFSRGVSEVRKESLKDSDQWDLTLINTISLDHLMNRQGIKPQERLLLIDTSKNKEQLKAEFNNYLDKLYSTRKQVISEQDTDRLKYYEPWEPDKKRYIKEVWRYIEVMKMRRKRISYQDIARQLKISNETARQDYRSAVKLTQGKEYDQETLRREKFKVKFGEMQKTCATCPAKENCIELCPEILPYKK